jgi:hypothetical protein
MSGGIRPHLDVMDLQDMVTRRLEDQVHVGIGS